MNPFKIDLHGRTVVITGAGGVLCGVFARALAETGANLALLDINYDAVATLADELNKGGGSAIACKANVLDRESLAQAHAAVLESFGKCDILINGAGGNNPRATTTKEYYFPGDIDSDVVSFFDLDQSGVEFVFNLNFLGTLLPTQTFAQDMLGREGCSIVNISSMNAFTPLTKIPAYSGAKAAVSNFTQWLAVHFAKQGIRVNALAPGFFITKQNHDMLIAPDGSYTARSQKIIAGTPMERFGKPEELVGTLLFLICNEASSFVTGTVIPIDGGFAAYSGV